MSDLATKNTKATKEGAGGRCAKYKPTGMPWLPQVPEEWEVRRARYLFKKEQRPVKPNDEIVTAFRDGQVTLRKNRRTTGFTEATDYSHYQGIRKGDLVIHQMDAFAGCAGVSDSDGMGTPVLSVCIPIRGDVNVHYVAHIVRLMGRNGYIQSLARGIRERSCDFRFETFARQLLPLPPLPTQRAIVAFLDEKCGKVDRLVAAKEKEVALLKELKQSMIAEAVTGRTSNRPMKPSGIPWLPELPEGWEVRKVRQVATENKARNNDGQEGNVLSLSYGRIIRKVNPNAGLTPADYSTYSVVDKDMVVLRLTDLQNDHRSLRTGIVRERGIITSAYVSIKPKGILPDYLHLMLHAWDLLKIFYTMGDGLRQTMNFADVARIPILLPSLPEQREIVAYIEARAAKIDAAVGKLEAEVAALKEYRERLVADVVTGQRKVA